MKEIKNKTVLEFLTNVLVFACLGIIIDYFAHTTWIFTIVGAVVGIIAAVVINNFKKKKEQSEKKK